MILVGLGILQILLLSSVGAEQYTAAELSQQAEELHLWRSSEWLRLLHYPHGGISADRSRIDSADFFLSPTGAENPEEEGRATIKALLISSKSTSGTEASFQCRYPARFAYVKDKLQLTEIVDSHCPQLDEWLASFDAVGVSLVYVDGYLNNPASMFGHTFLRVESEEFSDAPLLSGSIGFAAITSDVPGVFYAYNGIFGGYRGKFSAEPYDEKVREYGAVENRDIWEHHLDLTPEETRFLLLHVWELQHAGYDYFFFDENCSYQLLALLEVARPDLRLTEQFSLWTLPVDTFRVTVQKLGRGTTRYRPSRKTTLIHREKLLSAADVALAKQLAAGEIEAESSRISHLPEDRRWKVLELAADYLLYCNSKNEGLSASDNRRFMDLLRARSLMNMDSQQPGLPVPPGPLEGHGTSRLEFGLGVDDGFYLELGYRPALHDIFDSWQGYQQGAQIQLLSPKMRLYPENMQLELESMILVDILSVPERSQLLTPISWQAILAGRRFTYSQGRELTGEGRVGFGLSLPLEQWMNGYGLLGASVLLSDNFSASVNAGPVFSGGIVARLSSTWSSQLQGDIAYYSVGDTRLVSHLALGHGYSFDKNDALHLLLSYSREFTDPVFALSLSWLHYF